MAIVKVKSDGLTFGVSAALPATVNAAGFGALTFTAEDSCAIVDAGNLGDSWGTSTDNSMCPEGAGETKTRLQYGSTTMQLYYYKGDPLAVILQAAFDARDDVISCLVTLSNGDKRYFTAQVTQFEEALGSSGGDIMCSVNFARQSVIVKDGI